MLNKFVGILIFLVAMSVNAHFTFPSPEISTSIENSKATYVLSGSGDDKTTPPPSRPGGAPKPPPPRPGTPPTSAPPGGEGVGGVGPGAPVPIPPGGGGIGAVGPGSRPRNPIDMYESYLFVLVLSIMLYYVPKNKKIV